MSTAIIRQAIHDGPSHADWLRLTRAFDRIDRAEVPAMVTFSDRFLAEWPASMRVAPETWWRRALEGEAPPELTLVRALHLADADAARIAGAPAARQIAHLFLDRPKNAAAIFESDRLVQLESLALRDAGLTPVDLKALVSGKQRRLELLDLSNNDIPAAAVGRLLGPGERIFSGCALGPEGLRSIAATPMAEVVWSLDVSANDAGDAGVTAMAASPHLKGVAFLSAADNALTDRSAQAVATSGELLGLTRLDLSKNRITRQGLELLERMDLSELLLSDNPIGTVPTKAPLARLELARTGLEPDHVADIPNTVRQLDLSGNQIGDAAERLVGRSFEELALGDAGLSPRVVVSLVTDDAATSLRRLDLSGNPLSLSAVAAIAGSKTLGNLEVLNLSNTGLGDEGAALIARSRTLRSLVSLRMRDDGITPNGLSTFLDELQLPRIGAIDLDGPEWFHTRFTALAIDGNRPG